MSHRVTLLPSGHTYEVPEGKSVLTAGLVAGCNMPYSCRSGCCLTCVGRIVEGSVDYGYTLANYLTPERKRAGYALLCQAKPLSDLTVEVEELSLNAIEPRTYPCRVSSIERPAPDVAILTLRLPPFDQFRFAAGQYIDLLLDHGRRRSYSIASEPTVEIDLKDIELHVRQTPGGFFSDQVLPTLKPGGMLRFEGPLGTFYLREETEKPIIFVASGTGFAPIKSIISYARTRNISRPMTLYWGCRTRRDLYLIDLPLNWEREMGAQEGAGFRFVPVLSEPAGDDPCQGRTGLVHEVVMADHPDLSGCQVYVCGAPVMVEAARRDFVALCGLPAAEFFADSFLTEADFAVARNS